MAEQRFLDIQAVLFDYGMVLSGPPDQDSYREMQCILGVDEAALHHSYWKFRDAYDRGALSGATYWKSVARELDRDLRDGDSVALIGADTQLWTTPNPPMIEWAASLQRQGIPTGILSNLGDSMEAGILSCCPWLCKFKHHTFSHRLGIAKPDTGIYHQAAKGLNAPITSILFIDDKAENIAAANECGMVAVQYTDHDSFLSEMKRLELGYLLPSVNTM